VPPFPIGDYCISVQVYVPVSVEIPPVALAIGHYKAALGDGNQYFPGRAALMTAIPDASDRPTSFEIEKVPRNRPS